jgi:hypothetical protein
MLGRLELWNLRRRLRGSIPRDPLSAVDPTAWLDAAASVVHLRATCPEPSWLVHCAYWARIDRDRLFEAALVQARLAAEHGTDEQLRTITSLSLRETSYPELATMVREIEKRYPQIRGIEQGVPSADNRKLIRHLGQRKRRMGKLDAAAMTPQTLIAGGFVLLLVAAFHRAAKLRGALALCCGALATLFTIALPQQRVALLELQRTAYGWPSSMTRATFVK